MRFFFAFLRCWTKIFFVHCFSEFFAPKHAPCKVFFREFLSAGERKLAIINISEAKNFAIPKRREGRTARDLTATRRTLLNSYFVYPKNIINGGFSMPKQQWKRRGSFYYRRNDQMMNDTVNLSFRTQTANCKGLVLFPLRFLCTFLWQAPTTMGQRAEQANLVDRSSNDHAAKKIRVTP